ncbi:hypothetical protein DMA11_05260 [Marinilabiliaceae bacterium JC017]|nr:hypothetical protein DMA11_05260 [Marinilabiliaceae bacterium JC017]
MNTIESKEEKVQVKSDNRIWKNVTVTNISSASGNAGYLSASLSNGELLYIELDNIAILMVLAAAYTKNSKVNVTAIRTNYKNFENVYVGCRVIAC